MKKGDKKEERSEYTVFADNPITDLEKWIGAQSKPIMELYGIGRMNVNFLGEVKKNREGYNGSLTVFSIHCDKTYKSINISIYELTQDLWSQGKKEFLFGSLVHEFAHVLTTDLSNAALSRYVTKKEILSSIEELAESIAMMARELYTLKNK